MPFNFHGYFFSYLHHNIIRRECEAISGNFVVSARDRLASMLNFTTMQIRKINRKNGYSDRKNFCPRLLKAKGQKFHIFIKNRPEHALLLEETQNFIKNGRPDLEVSLSFLQEGHFRLFSIVCISYFFLSSRRDLSHMKNSGLTNLLINEALLGVFGIRDI